MSLLKTKENREESRVEAAVVADTEEMCLLFRILP